MTSIRRLRSNSTYASGISWSRDLWDIPLSNKEKDTKEVKKDEDEDENEDEDEDENEDKENNNSSAPAGGHLYEISKYNNKN